ncbi:MAG: zf-HC2 domain-containing protein [Gemmatimonadota bacterium]|nr:zf-HC2 domain-containing protein [Gemmatimonadota bacterium]
MNHKNIQQNLILYLEGEMPEAERTIVRTHLELCPHCRQNLETLSSVWLQTPVNETPPPFLWTRVEARIQAAERPLSIREMTVHWFGMMVRPAVMVLTLIIGITIGSYIGNIPETSFEATTTQAATRENDAVMNAFYPENMDDISPEMVDMADRELGYASR